MCRFLIQGVCLTEVSNIYLEFVRHLDVSGVRYALLHGWESLAKGQVSDIDLIVARDDLGRLEAVLNTHYRILNMFQYEAASFGFVLCPRDCPLSASFVADCSTDIRCRGRIFFTDEELLDARRKWLGHWVVGPTKELAYLVVKKIYEKGTIPEPQRARLEQLVRDLGTEANSIVSRLFGKWWGGRFIDWIVHQQWSQIDAHVPQLQRCMRRQVVKNNRWSPFRYWWSEIRRIWTRWCYPTGLFIAVLCTDVARKTSLIHDLQAFPNHFRQVKIFEDVPVLISWRKRCHPEDEAKISSGQMRGSWLKPCQYVVSYALPLFLRVRPLLARSALVIFQQYNLDLLMNACRRATRFNRFACRLVLRPDLLFIVGLGESKWATSGQRVSSEETYPVAPLLAARRTVQPGETDVIVLDSRLPGEELARGAQHVISEYLCKRYWARRHIWFDAGTVNLGVSAYGVGGD